MEGSGLEAALETVYAPLTVGHMFTGKAYARAIRGHMLSVSAVLSLLLEDCWVNINPEEQTQLIQICESPNPDLRQNDGVALELVQWFDDKKEELATNSRASAL